MFKGNLIPGDPSLSRVEKSKEKVCKEMCLLYILVSLNLMVTVNEKTGKWRVFSEGKSGLLGFWDPGRVFVTSIPLVMRFYILGGLMQSSYHTEQALI